LRWEGEGRATERRERNLRYEGQNEDRKIEIKKGSKHVERK
jgi:hypothetical protein